VDPLSCRQNLGLGPGRCRSLAAAAGSAVAAAGRAAVAAGSASVATVAAGRAGAVKGRAGPRQHPEKEKSISCSGGTPK
jgi:hypothetical protein